MMELPVCIEAEKLVQIRSRTINSSEIVQRRERNNGVGDANSLREMRMRTGRERDVPTSAPTNAPFARVHRGDGGRLSELRRRTGSAAPAGKVDACGAAISFKEAVCNRRITAVETAYARRLAIARRLQIAAP